MDAPSPEWCEGVREARRKETEQEAKRLQAKEREEAEEKRKQSRKDDERQAKLSRAVMSGEHFEAIKQEQQESDALARKFCYRAWANGH